MDGISLNACASFLRVLSKSRELKVRALKGISSQGNFPRNDYTIVNLL